MALDYVSLLLAAALSGAFLVVALLVVWVPARQHRHLVTSAAGVGALVAHVIFYWIYANNPSRLIACIMLALLPAGMAMVLASARQLYGMPKSVHDALLIAGCSAIGTTALVLSGVDGAAFILAYLMTALLLTLIGLIHWSFRAESRALMTLVSSLFVLCAASFAACGAVLFFNGQWQLGHVPDNWAERANIIVSVACMTGLGGLLLTLHNIRASVQHETEAMRDSLTGLMNRRALQSLYADKQFGRFTAVAMFDLDHFKRTNDLFGHAVGDEALRMFSAIMSEHTRPNDHSFRLGGEEFAMIVSRVSRHQVEAIASSISQAYADREIQTDLGPVKCTVSVGISFGSGTGSSLVDVLTDADRALYAAKREGRNRVVFFDENRKAG
ncbi:MULTISPECIES: GGDEF domain-containing protein [Mesorhizobium]|uniref:diguanylate cyclase n=1 Tax=Mesorhizobium denitrificans TaxID=2294114 RepID=A0A371XBQ6_9HYPH|nr:MULTISPECIES: GGDEF domain-containing protein [Mesorhizobium]RFC66665.1 GGDEF domain-containing protein [Mesorhizobium denitrificans]